MYGDVVVVVLGEVLVQLFPWRFGHITELLDLLLDLIRLLILNMGVPFVTKGIPCLLLLRRRLFLEIIKISSTFAGTRVAVPKQTGLPSGLEVLCDRQIIHVLPVPKRRNLTAPFADVVPLPLTHNVIF